MPSYPYLHWLNQSNINPKSTGVFEKFESFQFIRITNKRRNRYEHREKLRNIINHFWHSWRTEYVTNLREYQKLRSLNNNSQYMKANDVVLTHDDNAPRLLWCICRVIELIKSKSDNEVRGASVKVPRTGRTVQRPTNKLISIESHLQNNDPDRLRNAAIVGELKRRFEGK